jgi:RNA polymerase sigma factor (sigma-70 family)
LGDAVQAEDLAADVFAAAFAAYDRSRPDPDGVRSWLFRIARNAAIDRIRRRGVQLRWLRSLRFDPGGTGVEETAELRAEVRQVTEAVQRLRKRDRLLVGMRVAGGLGYADIGRAMGMRENAARMATQRALQRLRDQIGDAR